MSRLSRGRDPASEKSRRKRKKKEKSTVVVRRSIRIFLETRVIFFFYYIYKRRDLITHLKKKKKVGSIHRGKAKEVKRERERYGLHRIATQFQEGRRRGIDREFKKKEKKKIHERTIIDKCRKIGKEIIFSRDLLVRYLATVEFSDRSCNLQRLAGMGWVLFGSPPSTPLRNISF